MTTRHTTGGTDPSDDLPPPPPHTTVVVHWGALASGAPVPRDRRVLRWISRRARESTVWIASIEPVMGSAAHDQTDAAGVVTVATGGHTRRWLTRHRANIDAVVCTDIDVAAVIARSSDLPPLWLLDSRAVEGTTSAATIEAEEAPGRECAITARGARDDSVRGRVARVVLLDEPSPMPTETRGDAECVVLADCLVSDRSGEAEAGIRWFADEVMPELRKVRPRLRLVVASLDGNVVRRAPIADEFCGPAEAWGAIDRAAVIVVCRRAGPLPDDLLHELAHAAVAPVVVDGAHDRAYAVARCVAALERPVRARAVTTSAWRAPSRQGTLAAHSEHTEGFAREVYGTQQLPWVQALITNSSLPVPDRYRLWRSVHHGDTARVMTAGSRADRLTYRPLVSIVVPVHDTDPEVLRAMASSVQQQTYPRWQLCVVDDASTRRDTRATLADLATTDDRVVLHRLDTGAGIAGATNAAIGLATGAYVAFLDHDDVLAPDALYWIVRRLELDGAIDVLYSDEDKLDERGTRVEPYFKPDWSPDYLLSLNYVTHLLVVRRRLLDEVGGLREGFDGAQDYDLLLRLTEHTDRVAHIPAPLYSWRKVEGSTSADIHAKPAAHRASERALEEAIARRGLAATRERGIQPTWHRVRYRVTNPPTVSVVIPTRDRVDLLEPCVERVRSATAGLSVEFVIVDNESCDPATLQYFGRVAALGDVSIVRYPHRFNFARQMNLAALAAKGDVLLLLNNDVRPTSDDWVEAMLEHALRPEVGAVGARLVWPDGRAQHEGVVLNAGGVALNLDSGPHAAFGKCIRNTAAVTAACLMTRASVYAAVGGMDERLRVAYNDVDLCLRIGERGWRIVYTPYAELEHAESSTRGSLHPVIDEAFFQKRWGAPYTAFDPFYTPNLELMQPWSPRL
ncbi:MAG: glycosyltransferase family 2 protein [Acidimicrobiales bacterium]